MRAFLSNLISRFIFWALVAVLVIMLIITLRGPGSRPAPGVERGITPRPSPSLTPSLTLTHIPALAVTPTIETTRLTRTPAPAIPPTRTPVVPHARGALALQGTGEALGAAPLAIADDGNYLYVLLPGELVVLAPGVPPTILGRTTLEEREIAVAGHLVAADGYVYIAAGSAGLLIVDVREPGAPRPVGVVSPEEGEVWYVAGLRDTILFVIAISPCTLDCEEDDILSTIYSVDVTDPATPIIRGQWSTVGEQLVAVPSEDLLYVAAQGNIRVLDMTDPAKPHEVSTLGLNPAPDVVSEPIDTLQATDQGLYAVRRGLLLLLDLSNPAQPALPEVSGVEWIELSPAYAGGVVREPFVLLYDDRLGGLRLFDLTTLQAPEDLGAYGPAWGLPDADYRQPATVLGDLIYAIDGNGAVNVISVEAQGW